jgi:hypothetical protein
MVECSHHLLVDEIRAMDRTAILTQAVTEGLATSCRATRVASTFRASRRLPFATSLALSPLVTTEKISSGRPVGQTDPPRSDRVAYRACP